MWNKKYNLNRQTGFVTWLRAFAVICILLCHYVSESKNIYIQMTAQVFNIGVNIFFVISGFCFGLQDDIEEPLTWYKRRLKRIYIPYWGFLIFLAFIYIILQLNFNGWNWLSCILGVQGAKVGVLGADHTWFITAILICYLVTPFIKKQHIKSWMIIGIAPVILAMFPNPSIYTLLDPVCFYTLSYFMGKRYKTSNVTLKGGFIAFVVMLMSFVIRFGVRVFADGTILYDRIAVIYTSYISAFAIFVMFAFGFKHIKVTRWCKGFCKISFEIYLCHYMFVVGPISLMRLTSSFMMNMCLTTLVSCGVAAILNQVSEKIQRI